MRVNEKCVAKMFPNKQLINAFIVQIMGQKKEFQSNYSCALCRVNISLDFFMYININKNNVSMHIFTITIWLSFNFEYVLTLRLQTDMLHIHRS